MSERVRAHVAYSGSIESDREKRPRASSPLDETGARGPAQAQGARNQAGPKRFEGQQSSLPFRQWSRAEELANCLSHGVGLIGSLVVLPVLVGAAWEMGGMLGAISSGIFGGAMVLVYLASTLQHGLPDGRAKRMVEVVDRAAIYVLIAGTYTPFTLGVLRGPLGLLLLVSVWALAILGVVLTILGGTDRPFEGTKLYLAMGWLVALVIGPVLERMDPIGVALIAAGGVAYTVGVAFYIANRLKFHHLIWHLFVLLGSACHVVAALWYSN